jgi:hypothetical protein
MFTRTGQRSTARGRPLYGDRGETYGDKAILTSLREVAPRLTGMDPFDLNGIERIIAETLAASAGPATHGLIGEASDDKTIATVRSAFEVACWDLQGRSLGRPVADRPGRRHQRHGRGRLQRIDAAGNQYVRHRDDITPMRAVQPDWDPVIPRW